ncbi:GGDEF domain-containing protein [Sphingosinicellaceae bacterium]|nr:GGDEF domain-containing protein [Sphingosinicellaceae bacterium]
MTAIARAGCMSAPTHELRSLAELAGQNPTAVLTETQRDKAEPGASLRSGWRQAARAEAYDTLSRPADARRTALVVMKQGPVLGTPLQVELLARYAMNGFRPEEIDEALPAVKTAMRRQVRGSAADACLQITLGEMQRMRGTPERAVVDLAEAYRVTSNPRMAQQHVLATEKLARVIDWAGDHLQAISLIEEVIDWDWARGRTVALSTDLYFRGSFNLGRGAYQAALADFERSHALAPAGLDPVGSAFLDLQTCATLIELRAFRQATLLCQRASAIFSRYDVDAAGQTQFLLARIAFAQGKPGLTLAILDRLLAKADVLSSFASAPQAYRLRSDANRRLGRMRDAYRDLDVYVRGTEQQRTSQQARQSAVLRASFDADRTAARNRELRQRLEFSNERERAQAQRYTVLAVSAAFGAILLLVIMAMGIFHRRKLTRIAYSDPLTGLHNRRFVIEHESTLIRSYVKAGAPLAMSVIDMDHFKRINDTHGHSAGDEVLVAFAGLMRSTLRTSDVIARWGGEEFLIIFPHTSEDKAVESLERLRAALATTIPTAAGPVPVRFSAGVASLVGSEDLQTLVRSADRALYRAKRAGRDRIAAASTRASPQSDSHVDRTADRICPACLQPDEVV